MYHKLFTVQQLEKPLGRDWLWHWFNLKWSWSVVWTSVMCLKALETYFLNQVLTMSDGFRNKPFEVGGALLEKDDVTDFQAPIRVDIYIWIKIYEQFVVHCYKDLKQTTPSQFQWSSLIEFLRVKLLINNFLFLPSFNFEVKQAWNFPPERAAKHCLSSWCKVTL